MPIRLEDLLSSLRRHLRAASKAPRTIELYSQSVRYFSQWLTAHDRPTTLDELTWHAIGAWLAERQERDLGLGEMPYPPDYPKMPGEPMRVQPSRAKHPTSEDA